MLRHRVEVAHSPPISLPSQPQHVKRAPHLLSWRAEPLARKTKHLQSERRVPCDRRRQPQGRAGVGRPAAAAEGARK